MQQEEGELEVCVWVRMCGVPVCEDALSQVAIELYLAWLRPTVTVLSYNKLLARELCSSSFPDATILSLTCQSLKFSVHHKTIRF